MCTLQVQQKRVVVSRREHIIANALVALLREHDPVEAIWMMAGLSEVTALAAQVEVALLISESLSYWGVDAVHQIRNQCPWTRIIVVGLEEKEEALLKFIEAGANAYVLQNSSFHDLLCTIARVRRNEATCSATLAVLVNGRISELSRGSWNASQPTGLTASETAVLNCINAGYGNKQIADIMGISVMTAKNHVHKILHKFNVHRRREAILFALRNNLIGCRS